jgi:hypothetical protein
MSSRRLSSRYPRPLVDPLDVLGEIQAADGRRKIEVIVCLDRSALFDIRDTRYMTHKWMTVSNSARFNLPSYARNFADVGTHCLEKR